MSRPEHIAPADLFYNEEEAQKYTANSRMIEIQRELTQRCIELLALPDGQPSMILDVGCGSGLSGQELTELGHVWVGLDLSPHMLAVARERECGGDVMEHDMGQGVPFRPGTFDGVISVSALQWLFNADKRSHDPRKRFKRFFTMLYSSMARGARAVFQFYPETPDQMELVTQMAMKAGFGGGLVVDYPNSTRAKKVYLCLFAGTMGALPTARGAAGGAAAQGAGVAYSERQRQRGRGSHKGKAGKKSKEWILKKKDRARKMHGNSEVRRDTKYTGRSRKFGW